MRKAFICPTKYVQGEDEILNLGYFVKTYGTSALLIAHPDDVNRVKHKLDETAKKVVFMENVPAKKWHVYNSLPKKPIVAVPSV